MVFFATNGMEEVLPKSLEWARKAAEGGDRVSQYQMVPLVLMEVDVAETAPFAI